MGITVDWYNERKTIIRYAFEGMWDWDAFYVCWEWVRQAMESSDQKVSIIMDVRATHHVPANSLVYLRSVTQQVHRNYSGATVFVGAGALGLIYNNVLQRLDPETLAKYKVFFVPSLEEAQRVLDAWNPQQKGSP